MSFPNPLKKSAVALALIAPLALVACSSGESEGEATTSAATTTAEVTSEEETTSEETTTEKTSEATTTEAAEEAEPETQAQAAPEEPAAGAGAAADAAAGNSMPTEELQPIQGGQPADAATDAEISGLVNGWYEVSNMREFVRYIPDNTCSEVLAANGGVEDVDYNMFPETPMSQVNAKWDSAGVQSIENLTVDGNNASATVTVNTGEGIDSSVMKFKNEGNRWVFCN